MNPGAQTTELVLHKNPGESWGFRLTGGIDFTNPLSVSQVNPGGVADRCGLKAGDAVLRINSIPSDELEHEQAKYEILRSGDQVKIYVQRAAVSIWKPSVTPLEDLKPHERQQYQGDDGDQYVQKTSLAYKQQEPLRIGSSYNRTARPFAGFGGGSSSTPSAAPPNYGASQQYGSPAAQPYAAPSQSYSSQNNDCMSHSNTVSNEFSSLNISDHSDAVNSVKSDSKEMSKPSPTLMAVIEDGNHHQKKPMPVKCSTTVYEETQTEHREPLDQSNPNKQSHSFRMLESNLAEADIHTALAGGAPAAGAIRSVRAPTAKPASEIKPQQQHMTCGVCGMLVTGVFVKVAGEPMHADCYKCTRCGMSLKQKGYIIVDDKLCCDTCAMQTAQPPGENMSAVPIYR